jgi:glutamyl-tRNA(Gln) amidotransferase subunit D
MPYSRKVQELFIKNGISVGDIVEVEAYGEKLSGVLLPREEIDFGDQDAIVIKLKNGYNIGINISNISSIRKTEAHVELEKFPKLTEVKQKTELPRISFVSTGGTISSRIDYLTGGVAMLFSPEEILNGVPELQNIVNIRRAERLFSLASEDLTPNEWKQIARKVVEFLTEGDEGVVILHGTDTMHFTAAALSFMIRGLNAPVVLTGAQRSVDRGSRDSDFNIISSAVVAAKFPYAVVSIVFHSSMSDDEAIVIRGTRARKMHTSRRDAFRPINEIPLAKVSKDGNISVLISNLKARSKDTPWVDDAFEEKTALIKTYPGSNPEVLDFLIDRGYRGVILEGTGLGHVPTQTLDQRNSWLNAIKRATDQSIFVGITSQCIYGRVDPYVYRNARLAFKSGATYLSDMTSETAYVKLGWLLGHGFDMEDVRKMMLFNFAGEISDGDDPRTYLY